MLLRKGEGSKKRGRGELSPRQLRRQIGRLQRQARHARRKDDLAAETDALQDAAFLLHEHGSWKEASEAWIEILKLYNHEQGRPAQAVTFANLGSTLRDAGELDQAQRYFEKALAITEDTGDVRGCIRNAFNLGMFFASTADYPSATRYLDQALGHAESAQDREWVARCHRYRGEVLFIACRFAEALESFDRVATAAEELGSIDWAIEALCWMSMCYRWLGAYQPAIQALEDAYVAAEETKLAALRVQVMAHISDLSLALGDCDRARDYALKARKIIDQETVPLRSQVMVNITMGWVNAERGMTEKTRAYFDTALELAREIQHRIHEARILYHYAALELRQAKLQQAFARAGDALRLARETRDSLLEGFITILLGRIAQRQGEQDKSLSYRQRALEIAGRIEVKELLWQAHYNLGRLYQRMKRPEEAEHHYRHAVEILETLAGTIGTKYYTEAFFGDRKRMRLYQDLITHLVAQNKGPEARAYYERLSSPLLRERLQNLVQADLH
jgi:tetratricopeptide (TPR) repeat protein